jgi:uncharacterized MAPEG superfamily protein
MNALQHFDAGSPMNNIATTHSLLALLLFGGLTLFLVTLIAALRFREVQFRGHRVNTFLPSGEDVSAFSGRLCRAHANCYENLPTFTVIVGVAIASGHADITGPLALWCFGARVMQSAAHLYSTRSRWVMLRFAFMVVQVGIQAYWVAALLQVLLAR